MKNSKFVLQVASYGVWKMASAISAASLSFEVRCLSVSATRQRWCSHRVDSLDLFLGVSEIPISTRDWLLPACPRGCIGKRRVQPCPWAAPRLFRSRTYICHLWVSFTPPFRFWKLHSIAYASLLQINGAAQDLMSLRWLGAPNLG